MLGLFGSLNMGQRALQAQRSAVEVTGHNLANVNNPTYTRQRVEFRTSPTISSEFGPQGTGADLAAVVQIRDQLLESQLLGEKSVTGYLDSQQNALQSAQAYLGQQLDRQPLALEGAGSAQGAGSDHGIGAELNSLFNAFQSLSTNPASLVERQAVIARAQSLATGFNQVDRRLATLNRSLNDSITSDVSAANQLLADVAGLNRQIVRDETGTGLANDLRDLRQQKLQELSTLIKVETIQEPSGSVTILAGATVLVSAGEVRERLETHDPGNGALIVRSESDDQPLQLTAGKIFGAMNARDGSVADLRRNLDQLASTLASEVNTIHSAGFSLNGTTGAKLFSGTTAADLRVETALVANPALLQASGAAGAVGDNRTALALAQLGSHKISSFNDRTFGQQYGQIVAGLGESVASVNRQVEDQQVIEGMLSRQRESISGVSLDEEMTNLIKYQKAYEASARLISTIDEMLNTILQM